MSLSDQIKAKTEEIRKLPKIDFKELKYKKILQRIDQIEQDMIDLTHDYQTEFDHINQFMGCLCDKLKELQTQLESLANSTKNRSG